MHDLDTRNKDILVDIDSASDDYLRKVRDLSPAKRKGEMEKIQRMFKKAREISDDKVNIAVNTYELVDKHIRKLDSDLAKFESEMKEKGRLSQSEIEEEEEIPVKQKTKAKKKGNLKEEEKKEERAANNTKSSLSKSSRSSGSARHAGRSKRTHLLPVSASLVRGNDRMRQSRLSY